VSNLIETAALSRIREQSLSMTLKCLKSWPTKTAERLQKGAREAKTGRVGSLTDYRIFETEQFQKDLKHIARSGMPKREPNFMSTFTATAFKPDIGNISSD